MRLLLLLLNCSAEQFTLRPIWQAGLPKILHSQPSCRAWITTWMTRRGRILTVTGHACCPPQDPMFWYTATKYCKLTTMQECNFYTVISPPPSDSNGRVQSVPCLGPRMHHLQFGGGEDAELARGRKRVETDFLKIFLNPPSLQCCATVKVVPFNRLGTTIFYY